MKKIISLLTLFTMLFSSLTSPILAINTQKQSNYGTLKGTTGVSQKKLIDLIKNKSFTKKGILDLIKIKGFTKNDINALLKGSKKQKIDAFNKLTKGGLTLNQLSSLKTNGGIKISNIINNKSFLQKRTDLGNRVYQVNFKSITANGGDNSYKAGKVLANFTKKSNFPTKLVLPKGFSYTLKTDDLDGDFVKTNALKAKIANISDDIGKITISEPELKILPDRIQYIKKTKLVFTTEKQLNNIKTHLSKEFNLSEKSIEDIKTQLKGINLKTVKPQIIGKNNIQKLSIYNPNNIQKLSKVKNITLANVNAGLRSALFQKYKNKNENTITPNAFNSISNLTNDEITEKVKTECLKKHSNLECNSISSNNMKKELETEEVINIGLIPASNKDGKLLIEANPSSLRISQDNILSRFEILKKIKETKTGDDYTNVNNQTTENKHVPVFDDPEKYCKETYPKATETELQKCEAAVDNMKKITPKKYSKDLLNGFTIGENKAYSFGTTLYVDLLFDTIKVFAIKITFSYGYAFGIRIPIRAQGVISDSQLQNYTDPKTNKKESEYTTALKIDTLDGDADYYKNVLDDDSKVYGGKEFVFEFTANINIYIWIVGMDNGVSVDIPLVSTLIVALTAAAELGGGGIEDVANTFGLGKANIMKVFVAFITDSLLSDTADELDIDRSDLDTWLNATNIVLKGLDKGSEFLAGGKYLSAWNKVYLYLNDHNNPLHLQSAMEWSVKQQDLYNDYKDALKTVTSNWGKVVSKAGEVKSLNILSRVLQNAMITQFVANNKIDLGMNFKPPYGDEQIPLYSLLSPEIPFYNNGLFKLVAKIGVDSSLGGRITANCDEVNSVGACPNIFYQTKNKTNVYDFDGDFSIDGFFKVKNNVEKYISNIVNDNIPNSSSFIIGTDDSRLHFDRNDGVYVGKGYATDASKFKTDDLGRYSNFGIKLNNFRYHPILIFTLFAKAGAGLHLPYIGWYTYRTPKIDLYTFKFSSDDLYLSQHEGTDGELDMTTYVESGDVFENKVYTTTPPEIRNITVMLAKAIEPVETFVEVNGNRIKNNSWDDNSSLVFYSNGTTGGPNNEIDIKYGNHIYYTYTSNYTETELNNPEDPICEEKENTKMYKIDKSPVWTDFKKEFYNTKYFKVKAISCNGLFKTKTNIFSGETSLVNEYQQPFIREDNTEQGKIVNLLSFDINKSDKGYYLKINKANGKEGTMNIDPNHIMVKTEYIKYLITKNKDEELTCENGNNYLGQKIVSQGTGNNEIGIFNNVRLSSNQFGIGTASTFLKIVKCAVRNDGSIFQSYVKTYPVSTYSSDANDNFKDTSADINSVKGIVDGSLGKVGGNISDGIGKVGGGFNPNGDFMNGNNFSSHAIKTMNTMMLNGDMGQGAMGILAGMKNMPNGEIAAGFKTMLNKGQISRNGLKNISKLLKAKVITFNGLTKLASLYNKNGISYIGKKVNKKDNNKGTNNNIPNLSGVGSIAGKYGASSEKDNNIIKLTSSDEYVNEKLGEINDCFKSNYDSHLENITKTIDTFKNNSDKSREQKTKEKYQKAIDKLEEIKKLFLNRYKFILNYKNGVFIEGGASSEEENNNKGTNYNIPDLSGVGSIAGEYGY